MEVMVGKWVAGKMSQLHAQFVVVVRAVTVTVAKEVVGAVVVLGGAAAVLVVSSSLPPSPTPEIGTDVASSSILSSLSPISPPLPTLPSNLGGGDECGVWEVYW